MKNKFLFCLSCLLILMSLIKPVIKADSGRVIIDLSGNNEFKLKAYHYINYTIQSGDTLYKLALKYGTSIEALMTLNNIKSHLIYPGQQIKIPSSGNDRIIYTVKAGDSLYFISLRYNVSIDSIKKANNLKSDLIYVGQQLIIPLPGDFSEENNGREEGSYRAIQGKVSFNNKSWNTGFFFPGNGTGRADFPPF